MWPFGYDRLPCVASKAPTLALIEATEVGRLVVDATKVPNTLSNDASLVADCTVALGIKTLGDLLSGELEPTTGFMMGKFKVSGDMSVALKLQRIV